MKSLIVLDTTETFGNPKLEGPDFVMLRSYVSRHPVSLVIPQIVIEETVNHFREDLAEAWEKSRSSLRALGRLAPHLVARSDVTCDLDQEVARYREALCKQLDLQGVNRPGYDRIPMSSLVNRALARRRPFDGKGGAGFRDALIWETILGCLANEKQSAVILITRNKRDFGEHGTLTDHLADDLEALGMSRNAVTVCEGLQRFITEKVKPSLETLDEIERQLNDGEFPDLDPISFFEEWSDSIHDELSEAVKRIDLGRLTSGCVWHFERPSLGRVAVQPEEFTVVDVWRVSTAELAIGIDFVVPGSIFCLRETTIGPYGEPWDEEFDGKVSFKLMMTLIFNETTKEADSWELNDLEVELTGDWGFPEYD